VKKVLGLLLLFASLAFPWGNGYTYRRSITIDHTKCGSADSSNFPMLFSGTYSYLAHTTHGGNVTNESGYDIIFTSDEAGTTQLKHEIESYNHETGAVIFWVKIPTLQYSSDTVIYLFYGNSSISTSQEDIHNTWNSDFKAVWHMKDGTTSTIPDSTSYDRDGTKKSAGHPAETTGKIGNGQYFVSNVNSTNNDYFTFTEFNSNVWSVSMWLNIANSDYQILIANSTFDSRGVLNTVWWPNLRIQDRCCGKHSTEISQNNWHRVVFTNNNSTVTFYVDGAQATSGSDTSSYNQVWNMIGYGGPASDLWRSPYGTLDEFRLSTAVHSSSWAAADYNNQSSPSTFYTLGDEAEGGVTRRQVQVVIQ